ncbi:MAG: c-type cytochrome [Aquincola sp.]|nr:c-type cytochrome [Aquincola sp.]MDH4287107.1 c-type cytochrome [Aquincola sp.]MDH5328717.1 c-type cytochrome [Aquincola sp.]
MRTRSLRPMWVALCLTTTCVPALAQDARTLQQHALAANCANCHGTGGRAVDGATVPGLAGMPAVYIIEQMKAFKAGGRPATVMHQLAKGFNDTQIETIAAYFAAQKK